jgi:hypothetical protein
LTHPCFPVSLSFWHFTSGLDIDEIHGAATLGVKR